MLFNKLKNTTAVALLGLSLVLGSCEKKVLDLEPFNSFSEISAYTTKDRVNLAINGVYDAAQSGFYAGGQVRGYPFGAANLQQGDMRGEDMLNNALFYQITYEATYNNVTANNDFMFQTLYSLINKANLTMEGLTAAVANNVITADEQKAFEGELRFLRAMAYHELLLHFARPYADNNGASIGVMVYDFGIGNEASIAKARNLKRSDFTVANVYQFILADLDYAETNLPAGVLGFRAGKAAAIALKQRVKLHMQDWTGVVTEGNKLIPTAAPFKSPIGGAELTAAPSTPFGALTNENIFSIRQDATDNAGVNGSLASMYSDPTLGGRGLVRISPIIWSDPRWLCTDLRRSISTGSPAGPGMVRVGRNSAGEIAAVFTNKFRDIATQADPVPQIRYAEVLLNQAEAEARLAGGVSTRGLELLNAVRNRAVTTPADQFTLASFANKNALISAILFERRVEFVAEGKRWSDIHRLAKDPDFAPVTGGGIPSKVGTAAATASMFNCAGGVTIARTVPVVPYSDHRFIWPIPLVELQQNPNFTQNPNY